MAAITDYSTNAAKVRLLISDIDDSEQIFNDEAITAFLSMALDSNIKRAAALALRVIATNEVLVQKRIKLLDLTTDGPAEAKALRDLAGDYDRQANEEETDGAFDWAEMVSTPAQYGERLYNEALRS